MQDNLQQVNEKKPPLMQLKGINMVFRKPGALLADRNIHVLKDVDLEIGEREIVALVGESGCGKTTLGKIITGLYRPTSGEVYFEGERVSGVFDKKISSYNQVQFIQQDSYAALNPVRTIYQSLYAPIKTHNRKWSRARIDERIEELMGLIGLLPSSQFLTKYPHQLSGGQRQRILMARAISLEPKLIVADEPVSMIDVSLRLSLLNLMKELNEKLDMSFVYISHDLSTTRYIAHSGRVAVMYLGQIVGGEDRRRHCIPPPSLYARPSAGRSHSRSRLQGERRTAAQVHAARLAGGQRGGMCLFRPLPVCLRGVQEGVRSRENGDGGGALLRP